MSEQKIVFQKRNIMHMTFARCYLSKSEITILCDDSVINGKKFYSESKTRRKLHGTVIDGSTSTCFYFDDTPPGKEFKTIQELLKTINIKLNTTEDGPEIAN
jgi:hypothetical protein